ARELADEYFGLDQGRRDCELWHCDRTNCKPGQIFPTVSLGEPIFSREYCIGSVQQIGSGTLSGRFRWRAARASVWYYAIFYPRGHLEYDKHSKTRIFLPFDRGQILFRAVYDAAI